MTAALLELQSVSKSFSVERDATARLVRAAAAWIGGPARPDTVHAVDNVSLSIQRGEVVGLAGESGCGKSTLGRLAAGLMPPSSGTILLEGRPRGDDPASRLKTQMIFQDSQASLNPRMRVADIVGEAPLTHGMTTRAGLSDYIDHQLQRVGLDPTTRRRYPHQFSGGQRQRIGIARALAVRPELLICDEAVAALDVSIQAQILNLFMDLRQELGLTWLFISHDLSVIEHLSDRVLIMYLGRVVEEGPVAEIFHRPAHPYTKALLAEVPRLDNRKHRFTALSGEIPSPLDPPTGCHFHPRCPHATARCRTEAPVLKQVAPAHRAACHLNEEMQ